MFDFYPGLSHLQCNRKFSGGARNKARICNSTTYVPMNGIPHLAYLGQKLEKEEGFAIIVGKSTQMA